MMELVPLVVHDPPGARTTLSCSYRSNERLDIEFEALTLTDTERILRKRDTAIEAAVTAVEVAAGAGPYSWGANRKWSVLVAEDHRMFVCRLKNRFGILVGQLYSVMASGSPGRFFLSFFNRS